MFLRMRLPLILQAEIADCGHACVAMVSDYWGKTASMLSLKERYSTATQGVTLRHIQEMLDDLGLKTRALRLSVVAARMLKCPAILHWNNNHFVVLKCFKKRQVIIHDPACGVLRYSIEEFSIFFSGVALEVESGGEFRRAIIQQKLQLRDLISSVTGLNRWFLLLFILSLSLQILTLINPLLMQWLTDRVLGSNDMRALLWMATGLCWASACYAMLAYARGCFVVRLSNILMESFSSNVMLHLLQLPLKFFERRHKGDLQSKLQSLQQLQKKISTDLINTCLDGIMVIMHVTIMTLYSPMLTFVVLLSVIIYGSLRAVSYNNFKNQSSTSLHLHAQSASHFLETLQGIHAIKLFLKERMRFQSWRNIFIQALNADAVLAKKQVFYQIAQQFIFQLEWVVVICLGAHQVLVHQATVGSMLAFLGYRLLFVEAVVSLIQSGVDFKLTSIQLTRLSDIVLHPREEQVLTHTTRNTMQGALGVIDLTFRYNAFLPAVLEKINFSIDSGERVVIVGPSGCGKSTLLKIMMGILQPESGRVLIDGICLQDIGLQYYRSHIAAVLQEDVLLSGSILSNIAFFNSCVDVARVYEVARLVCLHDFIMSCPMGYETFVGENGQTLSGGQKQRLLLARALYQQPKILFLDEATSHLDEATEANINTTLMQLSITQIMVAHRQATISLADRLIVLS